MKNTQKFFDDPESVPATIISGYQNILKARKANGYLINVPECNINFTTLKKFPDNLEAIEIRAFHRLCRINKKLKLFVKLKSRLN